MSATVAADRDHVKPLAVLRDAKILAVQQCGVHFIRQRSHGPFNALQNWSVLPVGQTADISHQDESWPVALDELHTCLDQLPTHIAHTEAIASCAVTLAGVKT